jgi:hypothetical protein
MADSFNVECELEKQRSPEKTIRVFFDGCFSATPERALG